MPEHTAHHNHDDDGRSREIESYARQGMDWLAHRLFEHNFGLPKSVLELGCDYGTCLNQLRSMNPGIVRRVAGVDTHFSINPFNLDIRRWDMTDPNLRHLFKDEKFDLVVLNHSLEHVYNPYAAIAAARSMLDPNDGLVFIAVPHRKSEWAFWEYHYTIWDERWLVHFMQLNGFSSVCPVETVELRAGHAEIWGLFIRA